MPTRRHFLQTATLTLFVPELLAHAQESPVVPLIHSHAHNDYEHPRPLLDALDNGFCSIEADIFLIDGQLLVAHEREKANLDRTLQRLYLDPLRDRIRQNGGRVYKNGPKTVTLLVEFKSEAEILYPAFKEALRTYQELLTEFTPTRTKTRAITIVVTGNSPKKLMEPETLRYASADGGIDDLERGTSPHLTPLISMDWFASFKWMGGGPFPEEERTRLKAMVAKAHHNGQRIRFWGGPDSPQAWKVQREAGVDLIGTDRLSDLRQFLLKANDIK